MRVDGREVWMLAGSNPLDLAGDPRVIEAAADATRRYGTAAGGARLINGNLGIHEDLESALAAFSGAEAALLFSTGYMANLGVITTLAGAGDVILSDAFNHASIIDACRLSGAETRVFRHNDAADLERQARAIPPGAHGILVLDGVYSMDGDCSRLSELVPVARACGLTVVLDDVHGLGVLGKHGRGTAELEGVEVDVLVGNLGKALGSFGAFVACSSSVREWLLNCARSFIFTCGLAPGPAGAALRALEIVQDEPERREALLARSEQLRAGLRDAGYDTGPSTTHVVPALVGSNAATMSLCERALERGVYAQGIRYPSVPEGTARLRFTPMCSHGADDIDRVVDLFRELRAVS
ncbi:MAG: 8-amino-7-oxononanoate synthase [Deltaproteobacteria bacterium]|nr:8-amino-7-oxononanoate synthase [Deltaproteobacteria bacterium]